MVLKYCNISETPPPAQLDTELEILEETGNRVFKTEIFFGISRLQSGNRLQKAISRL